MFSHPPIMGQRIWQGNNRLDELIPSNQMPCNSQVAWHFLFHPVALDAVYQMSNELTFKPEVRPHQYSLPHCDILQV